MGYIPIVDFQHWDSQYFKDGRRYKDNVWEYYFEQPGNVSLSALKDDDNIIVSDYADFCNFQAKLIDFSALEDIKKNRDSYKNLYKSFNLISVNKETQDYLESTYKDVIGNETEVLGIILRGTDYTTLRPKYHQMQPDYKTVINKAKELYSKYGYKKIWLATEDIDIYNNFKAEFGDVILDNFQYKYKAEKDKCIVDYAKPERKDHFYNLGKEYLASMYILSKCKYLIGGLCSGTGGAFILSNGFENQAYVSLWNIGIYDIGTKASYNNKFEKVFSVKNAYYEDIKLKVITLLGIKIKIKAGKVKNKCKEYINPDKL